MPDQSGTVPARTSGYRATLRALWACRVSLFSVALGAVVLWNITQAQDLFIDLQPQNIRLQHLLVFYGCVWLFWMLPVRLSARVMLHANAHIIGADASPRFWRRISHLPQLLALSCLLFVGSAQVFARLNLPDIPKGQITHDAISQVDNLWLITTGVLVLFIPIYFWSRPREALIGRLRRNGWATAGVPGALLSILFGPAYERTPAGGAPQVHTRKRVYSVAQLETGWFAVLLGIIWALSFLFFLVDPIGFFDMFPSLRRSALLPVMFGGWVPFVTVLGFLAHRWQFPVIAAFAVLLTLVGTFLLRVHDIRVDTGKQAAARKAPALEARQITLEEAIRIWRRKNGCAGVPTLCPRPIIVAAEGGASRAAFFTGSVLGQLQDLSQRQGLSGPTARRFSDQLFAVSSVSGSALGAGMFAAGLQLEAGRQASFPPMQSQTREPTHDTNWFRNLPAALAEKAQSTPDGRSTWKDSLQMLLAGDFVSPVIAALGLDVWLRRVDNDRAAVLERSWERRLGQVLPQGAANPLDRPLSDFAPRADRADAPWTPLLVFNGTSVNTGRRIITSTMHPLTARQDPRMVAMGRGPRTEPVLGDAYDAYDLMCLTGDGDKGAATAGGCTCRDVNSQKRRIEGCDLRLSTAINNSARFPVIAPHGDIRNAHGRIVDRVVDGGYFDYMGVLTAIELAEQMVAVDKRNKEPMEPQLEPFILLVSNDPEFNRAACALTEGPGQVQTRELSRVGTLTEEHKYFNTPPPPPPAYGNEIFSMVRYPVDTVLRTRIARAYHATTQLRLLGWPFSYGVIWVCPQPARSGVASWFSAAAQTTTATGAPTGEVKPVSMSWWLSMPLQEYLDGQLCARHNHTGFGRVLALLRGVYNSSAEEDPAATAAAADYARHCAPAK